ncbi:hypothetical protein CJU90_1839 [Yarrowia sp. C11]|nr:hypothetical protein CKK34_5867 [Yarrowia sp. E02]KAG5371777.1 hypothetical protein CJU90_1839 [Yarrowia sp. C11]
MLSNELVRLLFEYSNLESCVALSQVCAHFFDVWNDLDESLVRERVVERAPWFVELDEECNSWRLAALVLTKRTKKALSKQNKHLYVLRDLSVAVSLCCNQVEVVEAVDFARDAETRQNMDPLFDEAVLVPSSIYEGDVSPDRNEGPERSIYLLHRTLYDRAAVEGATLLIRGQEVDLKTMEVSESMFPHWYKIPFRTWHKMTGKPAVAESPSGLRVVNVHGENIEVVDENDSLLLVRYWTQNGRAAADTLIHKASHCRDATGAYLVSSQNGVSWPFPLRATHGECNGTPVCLLPGAGGALAMSDANLVRSKKNLEYLFYVEPVAGLDQVVICELPLVPAPPFPNHIFLPFFTCYKGYLYLHLDGRMLRLWVDLGLRAKVSESQSPFFSSQALTVWDRRFPAIGVGAAIPEEKDRMWYRGPYLFRKGRYVTEAESYGLVVGDLETGTTYYNEKEVLSVPFRAEDGSVGFYSVDNWVTKKLISKMETSTGNISSWWNQAIIPQTVLNGNPVFTRVVREEKVADEPQEFEDEEREEDEALIVPDVFDRREMVYAWIYRKRPPLLRDMTTLVSIGEFKHVEAGEDS